MTAHLKARPTMYKGIQMRSRLEAGFAAWLDSQGLTWGYEPCAYAAEEGQYLPDFHVANGLLHCGRPLKIDYFFEIKPHEPDWTEQARNEAILSASLPACQLFVVWPTKSGRYEMASPWWNSQLEMFFGAPFYFRRDAASGLISVESLWDMLEGPWQGEWWKPQA